MERSVSTSRPRRRASVNFSKAALGLLLVMATAAGAANPADHPAGPPNRAANPPDSPADDLLRLVPPDVAVVVTAEGLREHVRAFGTSQLADKLRRLPAVSAWLESERFKQLERARASIEALLGSSLPEIRDEILGDAVVLALRLAAEAPADPGAASGLLLLKARDPALLKRLIRVINTAQQNSAEVARIGELERKGTTYHVREFPAGSNRQPEWYVTYPDGTFALSNSEALIQGVMDRKPQASTALDGARAGSSPHGENQGAPAIESGLYSLARLQAVQRRLPERAMIRVFVDPRPIARLLAAAARPRDPAAGKMMAVLERYLAAVDYAGASVVWSEQSLRLHTVEILDPSKLDSWIVRWAGDARPIDPALGHLPPTAVAACAVHVDATALLDAIRTITPDREQPRLANFEATLTGLLLGQDLKARLLPGLGPGAIAYLDAPDDILERMANPAEKQPGPFPLPLVLVVSVQGRGAEVLPASTRREGATAAEAAGPTVADALDNALQTLLALLALDQKRARAGARITTRTVAGVPIHTLDFPIAFAYAIDRAGGRAIVSNSADAIARYLEHAADPQAGARLRLLQAAVFSNAQSFGCIDLQAISGLASRNRERLVRLLAARQGRSNADVERDLTQLQALAGLIEAVFITSRIDAHASAVERSLGVTFHAPQAAPAAGR